MRGLVADAEAMAIRQEEFGQEWDGEHLECNALDGMNVALGRPLVSAVAALQHDRSVAMARWRLGVAVVARARVHRKLIEQIRSQHQQCVHSWYFNVEPESIFLRRCEFADYAAEGSVCWDVAKGNADSVLVLCDFSSYGGWWRPITAMAAPLLTRIVQPSAGLASVQVVYRVRCREVLVGLWSRTSHDDGIARICASDDGDPAALFTLTDARQGDRLFFFVEQRAWVYEQKYGGGADEHYAQFAAHSAVLNQAVFKYALERAAKDPSWWLIVNK